MPAPTGPARHADAESEAYGLVAFVASHVAIVLYFVWALLPPPPRSLGLVPAPPPTPREELLGALASALPGRYWALALPALLVVVLVSYGASYALLGMALNPPLDDPAALSDAYSKPFRAARAARGARGAGRQPGASDASAGASAGASAAPPGAGAAAALGSLLREDAGAGGGRAAEPGFALAADAGADGCEDRTTPDVADLPATLHNRVVFGIYREERARMRARTRRRDEAANA